MGQSLSNEYSSGDSLLNLDETRELLQKYNLLVEHEIKENGELLR